jgi:thioredoxin 1
MSLILDEKNFQTEVIESPVLTLVDFWAPWCGPCLTMAPLVDELAKEFEGKFKIGKVNVDENPELSSRYEIMSIPAFKIFKGGKIVKNIIGIQAKEVLKNELEKFI